MEEWNVEALAEIPLRREKIGMLECWNPDSYQWKDEIIRQHARRQAGLITCPTAGGFDNWKSRKLEERQNGMLKHVDEVSLWWE